MLNIFNQFLIFKMHLAVYLSLNALYFLFGVLLVNTIRKEFFSQTENKIMKNLVKNDIFIPEIKDKGNYYLNEILKMKKKPKLILMFPESNRLVFLDEFWSILGRKYEKHLDFVYNFIIPIYDTSNFNEVKRLESDIYTSQKFPQIYILKKRNLSHKIFILTDKKKSYDLLKICRENDYHMIQKIEDHIFRTNHKLFLLETYAVLVRRPLTDENKLKKYDIEMYRFNNIRYILSDMETKKLIYCQNIDKLFETNYYQLPIRRLYKHIDLNYKFLKKNFTPEFEGLYPDLNSTCLEILSIKYVINLDFQPFLYQIDRNVALYDGLDKEIFTDLINQVNLCAKGKGMVNPEKLIEIK